MLYEFLRGIIIGDLVTFEAGRADELEGSFQKAVDEYIQTCDRLKRKLQKAYKGVFNIRIDPKLHNKLSKEAIKESISLNDLIQHILAQQADYGT